MAATSKRENIKKKKRTSQRHRCIYHYHHLTILPLLLQASESALRHRLQYGTVSLHHQLQFTTHNNRQRHHFPSVSKNQWRLARCLEQSRNAPFRSPHSPATPGSTLVVAEHEGGFIKPPSLSALAAATCLPDPYSSVSVLLAGSGPSLHQAASHAASCHPSISKVLVADSDKFKNPLAEPWAKLVHLLQQSSGYSHIIAAANSFGKNVMPRAAALLDVSPITDVTGISDSNTFANICWKCTLNHRYTGANPCILTIRSTSFPVPQKSVDSKSNEASISQVDLSTFDEDLDKSRYISQTSQDDERPDLGNARIVVTGGQALKSCENFKLIEDLAKKLVAAVGATRAAVDAGYVPNDLQVGQTGKIVAPELYMAFGVSGAIQHLAGMRDSKVIVAVNNDADAPIFQVADYGLFEVIPELLEKLPEKK
uniref:Electron transfer flavoprotein subunit alpha, mitochondrial n=1 Tax=Glycine max TaxID=3847 RepID=A0A0R0H4V4_SOYBN